MVKNKSNFSLSKFCLATKPKINPISKQPIRLTKRVEKGKEDIPCFGIAREKPYLTIAPRKPPSPTINIFCNIY